MSPERSLSIGLLGEPVCPLILESSSNKVVVFPGSTSETNSNRTPARHWRNWPVSKGTFTSLTTAFKDGEQSQIGITMDSTHLLHGRDLLYAVPTYLAGFPTQAHVN
jgi:hypothetical protein